MSILCDTQIRDSVRIVPFADNAKRPGTVSFGVSSYGYDVRVGTKFKVFTNATSGGTAIVDPKNFSNDLFITIDTAETGRDHIVIPPNSFALAETVETIDVPRDVLAICVGKSTYARCGIIVMSRRLSQSGAARSPSKSAIPRRFQPRFTPMRGSHK